MISFRTIVKIAYLEMINPRKQKSDVIIFGAGEAGIITKRTLDRDAGTKFKVIAFIDDDKKKTGKKLEGVPILNSSRIKYILAEHHIEHLILSPQKISRLRKKEIIETCLKYDINILNVPPVINWINGELSFNQIKKINIEDLLGRQVIKLEEESIRKALSGKTILITGACGSIGSELVHQIAPYTPEKLILLDQAETAMYELELECIERYKNKGMFHFFIGDICNHPRMEQIFNETRPDFVYHAAAYKHVPLMEENILEALHTNVIGSKIIADLSCQFNVRKFIMVSTDKAVKPSSIMGASKRMAEIYTQSLNIKGKTAYIITRFGNVLGSNGSVIPLFKKQIEKGGPITITHPEVTRYFMTIPEACQLVIEAGNMGKGGEIYIFDMGDSIKILDLAKKMIKISGLRLGKDIEIRYTGLRPGEKLYEELLNDKENTLPTHHPQIMIARVEKHPEELVNKNVNSLKSYLENANEKESLAILKKMVPEYSNTSHNQSFGTPS